MPAKTRQQHVRPKMAAAIQVDGRTVVLNPNEVFDADHEYVKRYPAQFRELESHRARPEVESMTAAPGEKRGA